MIKLRDYQKQAVENLCLKLNNSLKSSDNEIVVFQAPTGSGKTIMVAEMLKELVKDREDDKKFSFIWVSVRMLHEQSKDKLEAYFEDDRLIECSYFEDLEDKKIRENEILFINWHSINKKDINIFVKENEQDNNLNSIVKNTKEEGREIILIIDESHHTANAEKSKEIITTISPKITLEVSATPNLREGADEMEKVRLSDVKAEEMVKSEIAVNPEFLAVEIKSQSADELVIAQALKKREELAKMYEKQGSKVNPLVLIQLPDKKGEMLDKKEEIIKILEKFKITVKNGKLAIWLSEDKSDTLPNIERNDNEVEVLIFKQAIALGWDCPRASILAIFRESKSFQFTIQTIGRIMRMPELKYYLKEPELNKGYIFTNLANINITEDYARDYITIYEAKRDEKIYSKVALPSVFLKRQRERTRLSGEFIKIFQEVAREYKLKDKIKSSPSKIVSPIIADGKIENIDKVGEIESKGKIEIKLNNLELQNRFDRFIFQNCSPYAPSDSSDRMKNALYKFLEVNFGIKKYSPAAQKVVLGKENIQPLVDVINLAKERYKAEVVEKLNEVRERVDVPEWEAPIVVNYNSHYKKEAYQKSAMKPFYTSKPSEPERLFIDMLDNDKKVVWWFKNGESEVKYFAVPYKDENGVDRAFYVDFIFKLKDGTIGLFDTKSGMTAKDAGSRAEGLQRYIKAQNKRGKKLWGGIAIYENGSWRYNDKEKYEYNPNNLSSWEILELK
jgi:type III restriction enzyme